MKLKFASFQHLVALVLMINVTPVIADIDWPEYSQACRDEAGPPYSDDEPGTYYHEGSAAYPVLVNGECAEPLKEACELRPNAKTAYLEGPISCGDKGWYCRIFEEDGWPAENLLSDVNFGECNKEEAFDDAGYDQDGHCHGSAYDNVYYWWIRDHWFRQYNGRVRCCCGWKEGGTQPLYSRRIANRCDYRRLVTKDENLNDCRDANEGHGKGFDDIGCDRKYEDQIGSPIPEDDSVCWEINRFGYSEGPPVSQPTSPPNNPPVSPPTDPPVGPPVSPPVSPPTDPPVSPPTDPPVSSPAKCVNSPLRIIIGRRKKPCNWLKKGPGVDERCDLRGARSHCPKICGECDYYKCMDSDALFRVKGEGKMDCDDVRENVDLCDLPGVTKTCRETCGYCD